MIALNVNGFTDKGKKMDDLNKYELSILEKIKSYQKNDCSMNCLKELDGILR